MARTSADSSIRQRLTAASAKLRAVSEPDLADAVDQVLATGGWGMLRRTEGEAAHGGATQPNMPIFMNKALKDRIQQAADKAGRSIAADINEGFERFLAGQFEPTAPTRSRRGSGEEKANLNVRPDAALREQVTARAKERSGELGWNATAAHVATSYLMHKYKIPASLQAK